jgi:hypothetical protein
MNGNRPRRRQADHSGADHDRLPTDQSGRHQRLTYFLEP